MAADRASAEGDGKAERPEWPTGWRGQVLTVVWTALLVLAVVAPLASYRAGTPEPVQGVAPLAQLGMLGTPERLIPFSEEARSSGIRTGDQLLAIDGQALAGSADGSSAGRLRPLIPGAQGAPTVVTTRSAAGEVSEHRLTAGTAHVDALFSAAGLNLTTLYTLRGVIGVLAAWVLAVVAALLFRQQPRQRVAVILSFSLLLLAFGIYGWSALGSLGMLWAVGMLVPAGWSLFTLALMIFPDGRFYPSWMRWAALLLIFVTPLGAFHVFPGAMWSSIGVSFLLAAVAALLLRYRRLQAGAERQQIRWALFGFAAGAPMTVPAVAIAALILPGTTSPPPVWVWSYAVNPVLLPLGHVLIAGGLLISLLEYRLYDADRVISRSVSFSVLTISLLALFAATESLMEMLGQQYFGNSLGVLAGALGAGVAVVMVVPLHHRLERWAERRFQKQLIRLRKDLPLLVGDLRETAPMDRIAAATLEAVTQGVRASRAAVLIDGKLIDARGIGADEVNDWRCGWTPAMHEGLDCTRGDPLFPMRIPLEADGHGRLGWLLLGPRPDGSFYAKDERETLAELAEPVARALDIARLRGLRDELERNRWEIQAELNADVGRTLSDMARTLRTMNRKIDRILASGAMAVDK